MKPIFVIAKKEFSENLRSMRFIVLFGIFVVMLLLAAYQGAQAYQTELKSYNDMMTGYQGSGYSVKIDMPKPSILTAFNYLISGASVAIIGAIIGIIVGFDAVSGERERGTLKFLLTQPLFRDTLINGKFLGFISLIFVVVLTSLIICIGVIGSTTGEFPDGDDLLRVTLFGLITFLYMLAFVVIGMFFSSDKRKFKHGVGKYYCDCCGISYVFHCVVYFIFKAGYIIKFKSENVKIYCSDRGFNCSSFDNRWRIYNFKSAKSITNI